MPYVTKHFRERMFQRFGVDLTEENVRDISRGVVSEINRYGFTHRELADDRAEFDIRVGSNWVVGVMVVSNKTLVTCHAARRMGKHKYKKVAGQHGKHGPYGVSNKTKKMLKSGF